jgi:hypothetical protein
VRLVCDPELPRLAGTHCLWLVLYGAKGMVVAAVMALPGFLGVVDHQTLRRPISAVVVVVVVSAVKAFGASRASATCAS